MAKKTDSETPKKPRKKPDRPAVIRSYSDGDKADALLAIEANGGNVFLTAKQIGIPAPTLFEWFRGKYINDDVLKLQEQKRPLLTGMFKDFAALACGILPSKMLTANIVQVATAMGIAIDKALALEGKSNKSMTDDECLNLIAAIVERAKSRRPEQDATPGSPTPEPTTGPLQPRTDTLDGPP